MKFYGAITQSKGNDLLHLFSAPPEPPPLRGRSVIFPPHAGGIEGGGKMALSFLLVIDQKIYCHYGFKRRILHGSSRS
jgi:hypothetical protein